MYAFIRKCRNYSELMEYAGICRTLVDFVGIRRNGRNSSQLFIHFWILREVFRIWGNLKAGVGIVWRSRKIVFVGIFREGQNKQLPSIINSAIVLFLMVLINSIVFLPNFAFSFIYYMIPLDDETIVVIIGNLVRIFTDMIVIAHSLNFFVYYWKIPSFRQAINGLCFFCCKHNRDYSTHGNRQHSSFFQIVCLNLKFS